METNDVIKLLSSIPVGTIIAWIVVISGIIGTLSYGIIKLYKMFEKSKSIKDENDSFKSLVKKHDSQLTDILTSLKSITETLEEQKKTDLKKMRHSIVRAGEEAISNNYITIRQLKALEEMYEEYTNKHGNGYVKTLMVKVRNVRIIGKLDENDEDINE